MDYLMSNLKLFGILFTISILCTVMFSEIVKKLDSKDILKGYKVYLPLLFSCGFSVILKFVMKIEWIYVPFVEGCMFGFSVFGYEVFLKSIMKIINNMSEKVDSIGNKKEEIEEENKN